ncbi:response regulator [Ensifer adhaerens]|uniref:response regulator n=1 Tax=Ensifer adhaerens TaxID=106592 RepID=UPI001CBD6FC6|nr:response regulator [Ensifer adhaerens]MBZ7922918.1 response regulator [Ensifer adhaerens]UAX91516.1 response regulator [Ensifer adhaerens]UAX99144.1 response regulator [Ensifer adhaerens]UAY06527.1 response regulator [Ensifer adhaerens]
MDEVPPHVRAVLILEDNFLIASDAEEILTSLGIAEVTIAGNADQAMEILSRQGFDFAILDVSLDNHTSFGVADAMLARGMPFGFTSGYGDIELFPSHLRGIPRIDKPFNEWSLGQLIAAGMRYE